MSHSFDRMLDKAFRDKPVQTLLGASPAALKGVSADDAQSLDSALGIRTVRDLAESPVFRQAQAVLAAAGSPGFDPGPPPDWETFLRTAPLAHYATHPAGRFRLDFGPVYYRGRLDGTARVLLVGQDPATDELLGHRILVGFSGQRVQGLLAKLGVTRSYIMINTFLFGAFGQFDTELRGISLEPQILDFRNGFLDRLVAANPVEAIIAAGNAAQHAVENWPGSQAVPVFEIMHPSAQNEAALTASWNAALAGLRSIVEPDEGAQADPAPYGAAFQPQDQVAIPRFDLPFGVPDWLGVGSHGDRDGDQKIIWSAP